MDKEQKMYDNNGYPIQNRVALVVEPICSEISALPKKNIKPYIIKGILYRIINTNIEKVAMNVAVKMTGEQLSNGLNDFFYLLCKVNEYCPFVASKQLFAAFIGISVSAYNELLVHGDEEQRLVMESIESAIVDLALDSAQNGITKPNVVTFRMKTKSQGHGLVQATPLDGIVERAELEITPNDSKNLLSQIMSGFIEDKK